MKIWMLAVAIVGTAAAGVAQAGEVDDEAREADALASASAFNPETVSKGCAGDVCTATCVGRTADGHRSESSVVYRIGDSDVQLRSLTVRAHGPGADKNDVDVVIGETSRFHATGILERDRWIDVPVSTQPHRVESGAKPRSLTIRTHFDRLHHPVPASECTILL